jgi:hypothetical protein
MKLLLVILTFAFTSYALEYPDKNLSAKELADPKQNGADKKILVNFLQMYGQFRSHVTTIIEDVNAVMDLAWAAQRQLEAIQQVATRIEDVSTYVKNYKYDNAVQLVKDMEENVFQPTDMLILKDIPNVGIEYKNLIHERNVVLSMASDQADAVWNASQKIFNATKNAFTSIYGSSLPNSELSSINQTVSSSSMASHTAKQVAIDNQSIALSQQIQKIADQGGNLNPQQLAEANIANQRNMLVVNYQSHEYQAEKIKTLSLLLLEKTKTINNIEQRKAALEYYLANEGQ